MLPINGNPDADRGLLGAFATATLPIASREGSSDMAVRIKLPPSYGSSKRPKTELIEESVLSRGPLWKNVHFVECNSSRNIVPGKSRPTLCQELIISLSAPGSKIDYTPTGTGCTPLLTVMVCAPGWDDYFNLNKSIAERTQHLMDEDEQVMGSAPKEGTSGQKDNAKIMAIPPNENTVFVPASEFPGARLLGTTDNPVNLSDAPTEASNVGAHPQGAEAGDESKILGHFSDVLDEMAQSIVGLEDGYFLALREVIHKMEKSLQDVPHINATYISCIITVMTGWQEAVQAATSHMESADTTIYLAH